MSLSFRARVASCFLLMFAFSSYSSFHARAEPPTNRGPSAQPAPGVAKSAETPDPASELPTIDVLEGLRTGQLAAKAEGTGDGRMTLTLTNRTTRKLRVVLPPGLIASGATGQFGGGMGGMGGGMGMMGGGMGDGRWHGRWHGDGGMGGGMGGMGGGMGMRAVAWDGRRWADDGRRHDARVDGHDDARSAHHVPGRRSR